jgi:hypothetical protein
MRSLKQMVGENIIASVPSISKEPMISLRLHGVTRHGIWVESQSFTDAMLRRFNAAASITTPILFIPFQRIDFIVDSLDEIALSEDSFLRE